MLTPDIFIPQLENRDLLWISYDKNIPENIRGFTVNLKMNSDGKIETETIKQVKPDPSTIWVHLPVREGSFSPLPYWPHYISLAPEQRFAYLTWLRDISKPIDTGFVFLYFYGLERHLIIGDIDRAVEQIIRLRNNHPNKSFQTYSRNSIIHACIMRGRLDLLANIHEKTDVQDFSNAQIILAHNFGFGLSADNLIDLFYKLYPKSRKAIKENMDLLLETTEKTLIELYGKSSMSLEDINVSRTRLATEARFCNYTFPDHVRFVDITDYMSCKSFLKKIDAVFNIAYENYKVVNRELKKKQKYENKDK